MSVRFSRHIARIASGVQFSGHVATVASLTFLFALVLGGCSTTTVALPERPLADRIPPSLLRCADRPTAGDLGRQSDVAKWVVELDGAGEDCRRKVEGVRQIVEAEGEVK